MEASASITINKPIEEVWDFVIDIKNMDRWVTGVSEHRSTSEGEFKAGSTFTSRYTYRGKTFHVDYDVTGLSAPSGFSVEATSGPFPFRGILELDSVGDRTEVSNSMEAGADSTATKVIFFLFGPLLRKVMRRRLLKELNVLKDILEGA